jgi:hypothetical protein
MTGKSTDGFFGEEATDQFTSAFNPDAGGEPASVIEPDAEAPKRKSIPSWVIITGAFVIVAIAMGGMALYRSKMAPSGGMPMPMQSQPQPITAAPVDLPAPAAAPTGLIAPAPTPPVAVGPAPGVAPTVVAGTSPPVADPKSAASAPQPQSQIAQSAVAAPPAPIPATVGSTPPATVKEEDVAALSKRVSDLEARLDALTKRAPSAAAQKAPSASVAASTPKPKAAPSGEKKVASIDKKGAASTSTNGKPEPKAALAGLRLRNITEGQAWIEDADGRTSVVGVGDSIAGAKITRINPDAFRVDTDRGPVIFAPTHQ